MYVTVIKNIHSAFEKINSKNDAHWIEVRGLGDTELIRSIGGHSGINPLVMHGIANIRQRPKFNEYDGMLQKNYEILAL